MITFYLENPQRLHINIYNDDRYLRNKLARRMRNYYV